MNRAGIHRRRRGARGQALTELALGITIFLTVLWLGIHFAELGVVGLKVHEAANFAVFEGAGERIHHFKPSSAGSPDDTYSPWTHYDTRMENEANGRYSDFDGRSGTNGGAVITLAETQASGLRVQCDQNADLGFKIPNAPFDPGDPVDADYNAVRNQAQAFYQDVGQAQCTASATVSSIRIPQQYQEVGRGGSMTQPHWTVGPWRICAVGRAKNGNCSGRFEVLLGDWSLDGVENDRNNRSVLLDRTAGDNSTYHDLVKELWDANEGSRGHAASAYAAQLGRTGGAPWTQAPYDETRFRMSYAGEEYDYQDDTTDAPRARDTGGVQTGQSDSFRKPCFLGQGGC